jgi:hypothetical protein
VAIAVVAPMALIVVAAVVTVAVVAVVVTIMLVVPVASARRPAVRRLRCLPAAAARQ